MPHRRHFLAAAAATGAAASLACRGAFAKDAARTPEKTWLTYAVNVETTWNKLPFLDRLRNVADAGFTHYEFWPWRGKDIDGIEKANKELGLVPVQFSASPKRFDQGITDPARRDEFVADITAAVAVAKRLGVKKLCVVAGEETKGLSKDEQTDAVIASLKAGAKVVEPAGITIILEPLNILVNHPRQLISRSDHAAQVIRAVDSPNVRILFDIYHQQITEGNLIYNIRKYHDLIGYYQLADNPGRNEPGTGEISYAHVLRAVHDTGYRDPLGLEMVPKADPLAALQAVRKVDAEARELPAP